jgi:hypothetical protein
MEHQLQQLANAWKVERRGRASWRRLRPQTEKSIWLVTRWRRQPSAIGNSLQDVHNRSQKLQAIAIHAKRGSYQRRNKQERTWLKPLHGRRRRLPGGLGRKMMSGFSRVWLARNPPQRLRKLSSEQRPQRVKRRRTSASRSAWRARSEHPRKSAEMALEPASRLAPNQFPMFISRRALDAEPRLVERNCRPLIEAQSNEHDGTRGRRHRSQ